MKITLNQDKLSKALQYTSRAVSQRPNIPILSNVLLDVTKNDLKLSATNLDMGINMWIPGVVDMEGKLTVSAKYIADFVSASFADKVVLEENGTNLKVSTSKSKANLATIPASEFPVLPNITGEPIFVIDSTELVTSLDKVIFSSSTDYSPGKIQQTGVLFEFSGENEISFVGLDGFRLSKRTSEVKNLKKDGDTQIIVPSKYLQELIKIIQDNPEVEEVEVYLSENKSQILFKFDSVELSIRLLEGPYPDYKRIVPDGYTFSMEFRKSDLDQGIKVVGTFARSSLGFKTTFDLNVEDSTVHLKSTVAEVGENEATIEVTNVEAMNDLNAAYNLKFLQEIVGHIKGEFIKFETNGPLSPSVFRDKADAKFMHLLMPLRRDL